MLVALCERGAAVADAALRAGQALPEMTGRESAGELALSQTEVPACWWWQNTAGSGPCTLLGMQSTRRRWSPATAWLSFSRTHQFRFPDRSSRLTLVDCESPSLGPGCFTRAMRSDVVDLGLVDCLGCISIGASGRQGVPERIFHELGYVR